MGPEKGFLIGSGLGQRDKICKVLQTGPKRVLGPGKFKALRIGPELQDGSTLGIYVINEAHFVIIFYLFTWVVNLEIPKTPGPFFL